MTRYLLSPILLMLSTFAFAQNTKITWGPPLSVSRTDYIGEIIHADENGFMITRKNLNRGTVNAIEKYTNSFRLQYAKDLSGNSRLTNLEDTYWSGKKFLFLTDDYNNKAKTSTYTVSAFEDSKSTASKETPIVTLDLSDKGSLHNTLTANSPDYSTKVYLIENSSKSMKTSKDKEYHISVFDINGEKKWQKTITDKGTSDYLAEIAEVSVNSNGDVFVIQKKYDEDNTKKKELVKVNGESISGYEYAAYVFTNNGETYKKISFDLGSRNILSMNVEVSPKTDNFQYVGMYGNKKYSTIHGIFFGEVDNKGSIVKKSQSDFTPAFLDNFKRVSVATAKGDDPAALRNNFKLRAVLSRPDGGAYVVFEYYKLVVTYRTDSQGRSYTTYTYYYNDIIVSSIGKDGNVAWNYRIPKVQISGSYIFSSIVPVLYGNKLCLIYNENPSNLNKSFDQNFAKVGFKNCSTIMRSLDPEGNLKTIELFRNKDVGTMLQPSVCKQTGPNTVAIYGGKFGLVSIKDGKLGLLELSN